MIKVKISAGFFFPMTSLENRRSMLTLISWFKLIKNWLKSDKNETKDYYYIRAFSDESTVYFTQYLTLEGTKDFVYRRRFSTLCGVYYKRFLLYIQT